MKNCGGSGRRLSCSRQRGWDTLARTTGRWPTGPSSNALPDGAPSKGTPAANPTSAESGPIPWWGMLEVFLISAAVHRCRHSGQGQYFDLSMAEATTMLLPEVILDYSNEQTGPVPRGKPPPILRSLGKLSLPGRRPVDRTDGGTTTLSGSPSAALSATRTLAEDPRFADSISRLQYQDELDAILAGLTTQWDAMNLMERLQQDGNPAGPAASVADLWQNPHLRERGFFGTYRENDEAGTQRELPTVPWRFRRKSRSPHHGTAPAGASTTPTCSKNSSASRKRK